MTLLDNFSPMHRWNGKGAAISGWNGGEPDALKRVPTKGVHPSSRMDALNRVVTKGRTSLTT